MVTFSLTDCFNLEYVMFIAQRIKFRIKTIQHIGYLSWFQLAGNIGEPDNVTEKNCNGFFVFSLWRATITKSLSDVTWENIK